MPAVPRQVGAAPRTRRPPRRKAGDCAPSSPAAAVLFAASVVEPWCGAGPGAPGAALCPRLAAPAFAEAFDLRAALNLTAVTAEAPSQALRGRGRRPRTACGAGVSGGGGSGAGAPEGAGSGRPLVALSP